MDDLAGKDHWDTRGTTIRATPPSKLNVSVGDLVTLLGRYLKPGDRVLEVGCAPGKFLLWCAAIKGARVCGVEYAEKSYLTSKDLFKRASVEADIRHEDFMTTSFAPESFDLVYSFGVIEHFSDPRPMVCKHYEMLRPGGVALMTVPHYGKGYGKLLRKFNRENYDIHNISIMNEDSMRALSPAGALPRAYEFGRLNPWILSWKDVPHPIVSLFNFGANFLGLLQPFEVKALRSWIVLELRKPI